jgi:ABC-2 type transport system permease protein
MSALTAEAVKFRTVPTGPRLVLAAAALSWLTAVLFLVSLPVTTGTTLAETSTADLVSAAVLGVDVAALVLIVLGALTGGADLDQTTFTLTPRRAKVVRGKAIVVAGAGLVAGLAAAVGCVAIGVLAPLAVGLPAGGIDGVRMALGAASAPALYGVLALAGALVFRSTGGGILTGLALLALPTVLDWVPGLAALKIVLPAAAVHGLAGVSHPGEAEFLATAPAALSLVGWLLLAVGVATWRVTRRDV